MGVSKNLRVRRCANEILEVPQNIFLNDVRKSLALELIFWYNLY